MSISPIITFKAGLCELNTSTDPPRVKPLPEPGYIYLYSEDDFIHFCWRQRSAPSQSPTLDLLMIPTDGSFTPYEPTTTQTPPSGRKPTNGRVYVLKFTSSSQRHLFWLQSKSQHESSDPAWFSARDLKLGQIVNTLLQGEEVDVQQAIDGLSSEQDGGDNGDDDTTMEDVEGQHRDQDHHRGGSGGAGPSATGGDVREEGQEAREGGADGGRAATTGSQNASTIIQNFLKSIERPQRDQSRVDGYVFTTLADLLTTSSTIPCIESADSLVIDRLLNFLPPALLVIAQDSGGTAGPSGEGSSAVTAEEVLSLEQKKEILRRVLRSPQFSQSLSSLTIALRDGGLPSISEALNIAVENKGFLRRGGVPLGGGNAVEVFLNGFKDYVKQNLSNSDNRENGEES